mmetsp:Transcript_23825/g.42208  ORF Transcript_23825/g.42208 Transcript_23825/m.42208 type:complete len:207 (+) Transcript_23825:103-723(+)
MEDAKGEAIPSPYIVVMRHSVRVDSDENAVWSDQASRPYDSPIKDFELPKHQAQALQKAGASLFDLIITSPYRRCLQTSGVLARELGVKRVRVNLGIGEARPCVRKIQREFSGGDGDGRVVYLDSKAMLSTVREASKGYVEEIDMLSCSSDSSSPSPSTPDDELALDSDPKPDESGRGAKERMMAALRALRWYHTVIRSTHRFVSL